MKAFLSIGVVLLAALGAACGPDSKVITAPAAAAPLPTTDTFAAIFAPLGSATRSFTAAEAGPVFVTLTSVGPPSNVVVGLGVGVPNVDGSGCNLTKSLNTGASSTAQITATVDVGVYCVKVYDIGNLTSVVNFSISILHP